MSNKSKIEICANSVESAVKAQQAGAYRVELCAGIPEGGTTPSFGEIRMARQLLNQTKLHVIIRPRGGDFLYSPIEQEIMLHDIKVARQLGADGVVFGCLTAEGNVDVPLMQKLMNAVGEVSPSTALLICAAIPRRPWNRLSAWVSTGSLLPDKKRPPKRVSLF